jgi:hypothetical protein
MDPTTTAAWIGGGAAIISGGWTALVAITTTRSARRTNEPTLRAAAENTKRTLGTGPLQACASNVYGYLDR